MAAELQTPTLRIEESELDYAKLVMEPLEAGFGTTIGNALRRVLLSSLPGAAITSVRIDGVEHEFSTVPHMQEDVTELLLNLKDVRLRAFADRPARLSLDVAGETAITAGDIRATADYEVANPGHHLATLGHAEASLVIDLNVETGRGYMPATVSEGLPIGVIPVDALFTPVKRVNYNVSHTRVGQDTNFDRLELEVWTDATIDGQTAISMAAGILREQLMELQQLGHTEVAAERASDSAQTVDGHDTPIETLELSVRAYNCLKRSGLVTIGSILERSEEELLALRNFGEKSYEELRDKLVANGFPAPRGEAPRSRQPVAVAEPAAASEDEAAEPAPAAAAAPAEDDGEEVGSLGAALIQALREAGEDAPDLSERS